MYVVEFDNGMKLENVGMVGGQYCTDYRLSEEDVDGVKKVEIKTEDGCSKTVKNAKIDFYGEVNGTWRFMVRELSKEERKEISREKKLKAQNEWIKGKYERYGITLPKGSKERIKGQGYSVNGFINEAVKRMLEELEQGK